MIDLREHAHPIREWLVDGLLRFRLERPSIPATHVALYCCPWSGWISLCVDPNVQLDQNCPDFEFVEVALYEASDWASQYEEDDELLVMDANGSSQVADIDSEGDEALNRLFFEFLFALLTAPETVKAIAHVSSVTKRLGVQLLDSKYGSSWELHSL
jgi:hypothetical protein